MLPNGNPPAAANQGNGTSPAGQPNTVQPQQGNAAQPGEYLTRAEFEALSKEIEEKAFTRAKNLYDAGIRRGSFRAQVQAQAPATQAPPASQPAPTPPPQPVPAQGQPDQGAQNDPFIAEALKMMQDANCFIEDNDPEIQAIDAASNGYALLKAVEAGIASKQKRTTSPAQPPNAEQAAPVQPAAPRAPTNLGAGGTYNPNPIKDISDPGTLYKKAFSGS